MTDGGPEALKLSGITAGYGSTTVLRDVSLSLPKGEVVALLGANGMGKTTTLKVAAGLLTPSTGIVELDGRNVTSEAPYSRARSGLCLIPGTRGIFRELSVADNLRLQLPRSSRRGEGISQAVEAFPVLGRKMRQLAGSMSGGEQQMLALSRAFISAPEVVMVDELSTGLAPIIIDEIFLGLERLSASGVSLLLVEQYIHRALKVADRVVLLEKGAVVFAGGAHELSEDTLISRYIGTTA